MDPKALDRTTLDHMVELARQAAQNAYAPASGFRVGAAVLAEDGQIYCGCNVENASYGLTICAERSAVFAAVANGVRRIAAVVVCTPLEEPASPCGACRQVLAEFGPEMQVVLVGKEGKREQLPLETLLPRAFRFEGDGA